MRKETPCKLRSYSGAMRVWYALRTNGQMSKIELSEFTGLSPAAVTLILKEMNHRGMLRETGKSESGRSGRRRTTLALNGETIAAVYVVIKVDTLYASVENLAQQSLFSYDMDLTHVFSASSLVGHLAEICAMGVKALPPNTQLSGIGIFCEEAAIRCWNLTEDVLRDLCREHLTLPFFVKNVSWLERELLSLRLAENAGGQAVLLDLRTLTVHLCDYPEDMLRQTVLRLAPLHPGGGTRTFQEHLTAAGNAGYSSLIQNCAACCQADAVYLLHDLTGSIARLHPAAVDAAEILRSEYAGGAPFRLIADYSTYFTEAGIASEKWKQQKESSSPKTKKAD